MFLFQSPPTVSGIVVLSGSLNFDEELSDFPATVGSIERLGQSEFGAFTGLMFLAGNNHPSSYDPILDEGVWAGNAVIESMGLAGLIPYGDHLELLAVDVRIREDIRDYGTMPPTTSGIVIWSIFPGASEVPFVFNARLFPIFAGDTPAQDRRIYPLLPQFSTIIP